MSRRTQKNITALSQRSACIFAVSDGAGIDGDRRVEQTGFESDNDVATKASEKDDDGGARAEKEGFVAGVRAAKRRKERYLPKGSADKPD